MGICQTNSLNAYLFPIFLRFKSQ